MEYQLNPEEVEIIARKTFNEHFEMKLKKPWRFSPFDGINKKNKTLMEVKSRTCRSDEYYDTMIGENKIISWQKHYPDYDLYILIQFTDGLFYYKYDIEDPIRIAPGGRTDRGKAEIKWYCYIPLNLFKKFENNILS